MLMRKILGQSFADCLSCRQRILRAQIGNRRTFTINNNVFLSCQSREQKLHGPNRWVRYWHGAVQERVFHSQHLVLISANESNSSGASPSINCVFEDEISMANEEVSSLCVETERVCSLVRLDDIASPNQILHLIEKLHALSCKFSIPKVSRKRSRSNHPVEGQKTSSPDSIQSILSIKDKCAENIDRLLKIHMSHHLGVKGDGSIKSSLFDISSKSEPNTKPFALAMEAWKETHSPYSGTKAADILQSWGELYGGDINHAPTVAQFNIVLETFANCSSDDYSLFEKGSFPAESAWELYTLLSRLDDPFLIPNIDSCSHLVRALSNHAFVMRYSTRSFDSCMDSEVAAIRAYFIWKKMLDMFALKSEASENEVELAWRAHMDILNMSSDGMLRREESEQMDNKICFRIGQATEELLVRLLQVPCTYTDNKKIQNYLSQAFSSAMIAWTKEQNVQIQNSAKDSDMANQILQAARSVLALLEVMKAQGVIPQPKHYDSCIKAYANCLNKDTLPFYDKNIAHGFLPEVRKLLSDMEIDHVDNIMNRRLDGVSMSSQDKISATIYATVIDCYYRNLKSGLGHGNDHKNAARVLDAMFDLYERDLLWIETGRQPLTFALNRVLQMISEIDPSSEDVSRAAKLITRFRSLPNMCGGADSRAYSPNLDSVSFGAYLTLLSRSGSNDSSYEIANVLDIMEKEEVQLENVHYVAAIKGLRKGGNGALKLRAKKLLFDAIREFGELSVHDQDRSDFNAAALYTSMISPTKSSEAISLLGSLQKQYNETMNPRFKPDYPLYCKVLQSISVDKKAAPWKDEKAFEILGRIEEAYMNGDNKMMPNKFCMLPIINILRRNQLSNAADIALQLLERMDDLYSKSGSTSARPDAAVFCAVMNVLAFSEFPSKAKKIWSLHEMMEKRYNNGNLSGQPSFESLSIVLGACANSFKLEEQDEALQIALTVAKRAAIKSIAGKSNATFYNNLIKSFGVLLSDESRRRQREELISSVFKQCCGEGLLDDKILLTIRDFFPELYRKLPGVNKGMSSELPHDWSRNCARSQKGKRNI
mmetsp:Transcript_8156/g.15350  ORF Transcript_8156/g.15350 Transcript_8156/m.15350 type:complete len:1054 (+) Transcript_8156:175-3336(+)